jgi:hypothetical protein
LTRNGKRRRKRRIVNVDEDLLTHALVLMAKEITQRKHRNDDR